MKQTSDPLVIVNADDFGSSPRVNSAIIGAFKSGLIDSSTIMANFPGFEEACDAAHADGFSDRIGIHFVLDDGVPLTENILHEPRFCAPDGHMLPRKPGRLLHLSSPERRAVASELRAQIARCRSFGLPLTHLDSHHHIHEDLGIIRVVLVVMREQGIKFVRPMRNLGKFRTQIRRVYTYGFNAEIRRRRIARTQYFGSMADYMASYSSHNTPPSNATIELMVHPTMGPDGAIVDAPNNTGLSEAVSAVRRYRRLAVQTGAAGRLPSQLFS